MNIFFSIFVATAYVLLCARKDFQEKNGKLSFITRLTKLTLEKVRVQESLLA